MRTWTLDAGSENLETEYTYDLVGNLDTIAEDGTLVADYAHGASGRPHVIDHNGFGDTYAHDYRGRLTELPDRKISYTRSDLPKRVSTSTDDWDLRYDASRSRVVKTNGGETDVTISGLYERKTTSEDVVHTFHVYGTDGAVADIQLRESDGDRSIRYLSADRNGTISLVTDKDGAENGRQYFDPFGQPIEVDASPLLDDLLAKFGFGAHPHDGELGLVDMGGRVYVPEIQRFLTPDPLVPQPMTGQSYNRYSFAFNNPVTLIDPDGHSPDFPGGMWGGGSFGFVFHYSSATGALPFGGGSGGSSEFHRFGGQSSTPKAPPPPPLVRTNLGRYGAGWEQARDPAPGCLGSKGAGSSQPCAGPGAAGCTSKIPSQFLVGTMGLEKMATPTVVAGGAVGGPAGVRAIFVALQAAAQSPQLREGWNRVAPHAGIWLRQGADAIRTPIGMYAMRPGLAQRGIVAAKTLADRYNNMGSDLARRVGVEANRHFADLEAFLRLGEFAPPLAWGHGAERLAAGGRTFVQVVGPHYGGPGRADFIKGAVWTDITTFSGGFSHYLRYASEYKHFETIILMQAGP